MLQIIKPGTKIDFMGRYKIFFAVSAAMIILSFGVILTKGYNYGIDFAGGTVIQASFEKAPDLEKIRSALGSMGLGELVIQNFGEDTDVLVRVEKSSLELEEVSRLIKQNLFETFTDNKVVIERVEQVGPQVGSELKKKATMAVIYALIGVLIYIAFRFQVIYAMGAVAALFHDVVITLGIFSIAGMEISLTIVAAVLTIVGYSLNDTIVVFDRIRERTKDMKGLSLREAMNISINETLSRTVLTSVTTLLAVLSLYIFGGAVIHGFAFALLVGVIVGTYSSIGIASSLVYMVNKKKH